MREGRKDRLSRAGAREVGGSQGILISTAPKPLQALPSPDLYSCPALSWSPNATATSSVQSSWLSCIQTDGPPLGTVLGPPMPTTLYLSYSTHWPKDMRHLQAWLAPSGTAWKEG